MLVRAFAIGIAFVPALIATPAAGRAEDPHRSGVRRALLHRALMALEGRKDDAVRLLQLAAAGCPGNFIAWDAARAELRLLGVRP